LGLSGDDWPQFTTDSSFGALKLISPIAAALLPASPKDLFRVGAQPSKRYTEK
jgi:hypothetical protein